MKPAILYEPSQASQHLVRSFEFVEFEKVEAYTRKRRPDHCVS